MNINKIILQKNKNKKSINKNFANYNLNKAQLKIYVVKFNNMKNKLTIKKNK